MQQERTRWADYVERRQMCFFNLNLFCNMMPIVYFIWLDYSWAPVNRGVIKLKVLTDGRVELPLFGSLTIIVVVLHFLAYFHDNHAM